LAQDRQVLIYDQPIYSEVVSAKDKLDPKNALDFLANGVLAAAEAAGFIGKDKDGNTKVVDVAAHSLGGLVLDRVKQLAQERKIKAFDQEHGAKIALIAPTGSNNRENYFWLGGRWAPYMAKSVIEGKTLDPSGEKGKALLKNTSADIPKGLGEVRAMAKDRINYKKFGKALVLVYPEDRMFPENGKAVRYRQRPFMKKPIQKGFINEALAEELPIIFATPYAPDKVAVKGIKRMVSKAALKTKMRSNYVRSSRGAGHNDPTDNPMRTAIGF
jgi:hypothetical protein